MENESFSLQLALLECSLQTCALVLLTLLIWDIWRSYKTSSHWVPITPVLLNTVVLLLLNDVAWDLVSLAQPNTIWEKHILFDLSALVFPVYIAYVMPEAAGHGFLRMLPYNGAIGLSLGIRISSGLNVMLIKDYHPVYVDQKCNFSDGHHGSIKNWYIISVSTVFATNVILFLLLLFSTACVRGIALKSANATRLLLDKQAAEVPQSLKNKEEPGKQAAQVRQSLKSKEEQNKQAAQVEYDVVDAVKVRWLQARSWRPDYVFATSVLSVIVGWLVNICMVAYVVKWSFMWLNHWKCLPTGAAEKTQLLPRSYFVRSLILVERTTAVSLVAFIAIGLGTVSWRWLSAVYYFPRKHACVFMEDAWKPWVLRWRYYVDLHAPESKSRRKICHLFVRLPLLAMAWMAWQVLVTVGKVIWFLTEWLIVRWVRILVMDDEIWKLMYGRGKKENRLMDPWRESCNKAANENGRVLLSQYIENGKTSVLFNSEELRDIIPKDKSFPDNIDNIFWQSDSAHIAVEKNLSESGRPSFKMMMVSLLRIMMCLQTKSMDDAKKSMDDAKKVIDEAIDGAEKVIDDAKKVKEDAKKNIDRAKKNMDDAIKACRQAWNVLELVDYGEGVLDLVGFIAEREFEQLQMEWKSYKLSDYKRNGKFMPEKMKRRMEKALRRTDWPRIENDLPVLGDWKEAIVDLHQYKACKDLIIHFRPCSEQQSTQHPCSQQQSTQYPCSEQSTQHQCSQPSTQHPCPGQSTQAPETLLACVMNLKLDVLQKAMGIVIRHAIVNNLKPAILKKCNESNDIEILQSAFSIGQGQALLETCLRKDGDTPTDEGTSSRTRPIKIK